MKKTFRCPNCGNKVEIKGIPGKKKTLVCPKCGKKGFALFPKLIKYHKKKLISSFGAIVVVLLFIFFIVIPTLTETLHFLTVLSGSMEPSMHTGDIVVSMKIDVNTIQIGDIITFRYDDETDPNRCVTHRVSNITYDGDNTYFSTKGDSNEENDTRIVKSSEVIGKVVFIIPYLGYISNFARSIWGFMLFIVIPVSLIIVHELRTIIKIYKK